MLDVAIVGGGPAGLLAASRLAESGLDVAVFEEHPEIGQPAHCTGIISLEVAELAKLPHDATLARLTRARLYGPRSASAEFAWSAEAEPILTIDRGTFDRGLAAEARRVGATIHTSARCLNVETAGEAVRLDTVIGPARARACILACGVSYGIQRRLGLGLPGQMLHTAQIEVDADPGDVVEMHFGRQVAPDGFLWAVPIVRCGTPRLKIGVMVKGDAAAYLDAFLRRPTIRMRLRGEAPAPIRRLLPLKTIPKTFGHRVLAVGDAGGFTKPTTGGGIWYSLLTATLAAETLIAGFREGRLDEAFLSRYEKRWQDRLGQELQISDWLRGFVGGWSDPAIEACVAALGSREVQAVIGRTARFNWHRDVILSLLRQPGIKLLLVRAFFR